jgi:hypothetical protein
VKRTAVIETNRAEGEDEGTEGEDVAEPDEGENEPLKLQKTAAENLFCFWYATFQVQKVLSL